MSFDYNSYVKDFGGEITEVFDKYLLVKYDDFLFKLYKDKMRKVGVKPKVSNCLDKVLYFRKIVVSDKHPNLRFDKYVFNGMRNNSIVNCIEHGDFEADAYRLLKLKSGCAKCYNKYNSGVSQRKTNDEFISESISKFGDSFDYSKCEYKNTMTHVTLGCPIHGFFNQTPNEHLQSVTGCTQCGRELSSGYSMSDYGRVCKDGSNIYVFKLTVDDEVFCKVGISKDPIKRLKMMNREGVVFVEGFSFYLKDSELIWSLEKDTHNFFNEFKYKPSKLFSGYTECFVESCYGDVINYLNNVLSIVR